MIHTDKTRRKTIESGTIGLVTRSVGFLQGGYKDSVLRSEVQKFNTITGTGQIVIDTGYDRWYTPGTSGDLAGYYSINDNVNYNKFIYQTYASLASFTIPTFPRVSFVNWGVTSQSWMATSTIAANWTDANDVNSNWYRINVYSDTPTSYGVLRSDTCGTTRQGLSTALVGAHRVHIGLALSMLIYETASVTTSPSHSNFTTTIQQVPCGMSRNVVLGYYIGLQVNVRVQFAGTAIVSFTQTTSYVNNFGESHSVTSETEGYMMAGHPDNTGRYGGTQHGLCNKIIFETETIIAQPDLVIPQSSGQMMQGF